MERKRVQIVFEEPSLTKQSFKNDCDINCIVKRFKKVAGFDLLNNLQGYVGGRFGDFSEVVDYRTALDQVNRAKEVFGALPAKVRARFLNDPAEFLDFCGNPENIGELREMGLANPLPETDASKVGESKQS